MASDNLRWWILLTVIIGTFLGRLDQTIVNLAIPKIMSDFGITFTEAGWIATAYILANAIFVPIWGKLGDTVGRKKVYILGFTIFIIGSVLAGMAWNLTSMIGFRIIQAIAGSADYPTAMAILAVTFKGKERAEALGLWSASFAAASVFGPLIGGPLIDTFGWRSIFLVNLPVGMLGLAMALVFVKESVSEKKTVEIRLVGGDHTGHRAVLAGAGPRPRSHLGMALDPSHAMLRDMRAVRVHILPHRRRPSGAHSGLQVLQDPCVQRGAHEQRHRLHGHDGQRLPHTDIRDDLSRIRRDPDGIPVHAHGVHAHAWPPR